VGSRRIAERETKAIGRGIQPALEIDEYLRRPQPPAQLFARDHLAGAFRQRAQDLKRLALKFQPDAMLSRITGSFAG
jgi:hypothetical protein